MPQPLEYAVSRATTPGPRRRARLVAAVALAAALLVPAVPFTAGADEALEQELTTTTTQTLTVNWATWLPSYISEYTPGSSDECLAGKDNCATKTVKEMTKRLDALTATCDHNAVFSLAYTRITQGYTWIRDTVDANGVPHYEDKAWLNYVVETFARAYLWAFDEWSSRGTEAPLAWQIAFDAAATSRITGTGDLLLGINAHINRDLPFVMAAAGLVRPDGMSGKPDYDKVNELLLRLTKPLTAELSARLDPSMANGDGSLADPASYQLIVGWRERAWRNAEDLVRARSDDERELVAQRIEKDAAAEAALLLASNSYAPPLTTTKPRDNHCAAHNADPPPQNYPFALK
ncbi:MAG: hypothetical protein GEV04_14220 [Actinophytocola sp.]|nr:hypothetical protein [Actinophytocola sp.]